MNLKKATTKLKGVFDAFTDELGIIYKYIFLFYIISLVFAVIFPVWKNYFNWQMFHANVILLGVLYLTSGSGQKMMRKNVQKAENVTYAKKALSQSSIYSKKSFFNNLVNFFRKIIIIASIAGLTIFITITSLVASKKSQEIHYHKALILTLFLISTMILQIKMSSLLIILYVLVAVIYNIPAVYTFCVCIFLLLSVASSVVFGKYEFAELSSTALLYLLIYGIYSKFIINE